MIEHELYDPPGATPWATVRFKERGREIARINIRWTGKALRAEFVGSEEKAKALASLLGAMGAEVEARRYGSRWRVVMATDSIASIRDERWLTAVRALVDELRERGVISEEQWEQLKGKIESGPNVVEIAGVRFSVRIAMRRGKSEGKTSRRLIIDYRPRSPEAFDRAVEALKRVGFVEGRHFTAKRPEGGGKQGYVRLTAEGLWRLVLMAKEGAGWAARALNRLESVARARGFYDLLERHMGLKARARRRSGRPEERAGRRGAEERRRGPNYDDVERAKRRLLEYLRELAMQYRSRRMSVRIMRIVKHLFGAPRVALAAVLKDQLIESGCVVDMYYAGTSMRYVLDRECVLRYLERAEAAVERAVAAQVR